MEKMETDIIVVAAGLSGLAAAISAAENGAGVLVFEKSGTTGGAANMGMGPHDFPDTRGGGPQAYVFHPLPCGCQDGPRLLL